MDSIERRGETQQLMSPARVTAIAKMFHQKGVLSPEHFDDAQEARERLVRAFERLVIDTSEYLTGDCDTLIIDQKSGNLPGVFFKQLCAEIQNKTGKSAPRMHDVVGSVQLPDRERVLKEYFRGAINEKTIGNHILIVTEHAISRVERALVTLADCIREAGNEAGNDPDIRIAALSIGHTGSTRLQEQHKTYPNTYRWYVGEDGQSIGSSAFHRPFMNDLANNPGSARPKLMDHAGADSPVECAKQDMILLAKELAPLVLKNRANATFPSLA